MRRTLALAVLAAPCAGCDLLSPTEWSIVWWSTGIIVAVAFGIAIFSVLGGGKGGDDEST